MSTNHINRRELLKRGAIGGVGLAGLGAGLGSFDVGRAFAHADDAAATGLDPMLVAAAKKDGHLNTITLPVDWANYGEIMNTFQKRYGIVIADAIPNGSSAQEIAAIKNLKGLKRAPDVVDVSQAWAATGASSGLFAPYKVATWSTIPNSMKEPTGLWYGDYYGVIAFMSNNSTVKQAPKDWSDLTSPTLKGQVALGDDPRKAGEAFAAVFAASLANGGSLDNIEPGIEFFSKLKKSGNFILSQALNANFAKGEMGVAIRWDYLLLAARDGFKNNPSVSVNIPLHGRYAGPYFQAISKFAPYPNAAKLWQEFLYSDEGQLLFLKGYTHPARYADLAKRKMIPAALASKLPSADQYAGIKFATLAQINNAQKVLQAQWGPKVRGHSALRSRRLGTGRHMTPARSHSCKGPSARLHPWRWNGDGCRRINAFPPGRGQLSAPAGGRRRATKARSPVSSPCAFLSLCHHLSFAADGLARGRRVSEHGGIFHHRQHAITD